MFVRFRFKLIALLSFFTVLLEPWIRKIIIAVLCSVLGLNSLAINGKFLSDNTANAALIDNPSTVENNPNEKEPIAICLPIVGCVKTPVPDAIEKPLENVIKNKVYQGLSKVLGQEAPIVSSTKAVFPLSDTLPGNAFDNDGNASQLAKRLTLLPDGSIVAPAGDYRIPLDVYCMKHNVSSPNGHRYLLAPLKGKMAESIAALNARSLGYGISHSQLQVLSWNIQAGMKYENMTPKNQQIVNNLLPDYKDKLSRSFIERLEATYSKYAPKVKGFPRSLNAALDDLGDVGKTIKNLKKLHQTLQRYGNDYDSLSRLLITSSSRSEPGYQRGGTENTPWSKIDSKVYARLVTEGNYKSKAELQLRVLPQQSERTALNKSISEKSHIIARNPCTNLAQSPLTRIPLTRLVGDSQSSRIQPLSMSPQIVSLILDFTPIGRAKAVLEALRGQDLITQEELAAWERLLGIIPGGRSAGRVSRTTGIADDAEDLIGAGNRAKGTFIGTLKGKPVVLPKVNIKQITYKKRTREETQKLRNKFGSSVRKNFVKSLANDANKVKKLKQAGLTDVDIKKLKAGQIPTGWQVHHKIPLDGGGTNDFDNLILMKNDPYHKALTNAQRKATKCMVENQTKVIDWPIPDGFVYPPKKKK